MGTPLKIAALWLLSMLASLLPATPAPASTNAMTCPALNPTPSQPAQKRGLALIIAVSDYNGDGGASSDTSGVFLPDLPNATRDGELVARTLCNLSYDVTFVRDPARDELVHSMAAFRVALENKPGIPAIVFYSGHAIQVGDRNWLIPSLSSLPLDTNLARQPVAMQEAMLEGHAVRLQLILDQLGDRGGENPVNLVFIDACRDNPWDRIWGRSRGAGGLARQEPPGGSSMLVTYSTFSGGAATDGPSGGNSPFAANFARLASQAGLEIREVLTQVDARVRDNTSGRQSVVTVASLGQRFCLSGCRPNTREIVSTGRGMWENAFRAEDAAQCILRFVTDADQRSYDAVLRLPGQIDASEASDEELFTSAQDALREYQVFRDRFYTYIDRCRQELTEGQAIQALSLASALFQQDRARIALVSYGVAISTVDAWFSGLPQDERTTFNFRDRDDQSLENLLQRAGLADEQRQQDSALALGQYLAALVFLERTRLGLPGLMRWLEAGGL